MIFESLLEGGLKILKYLVSVNIFHFLQIVADHFTTITPSTKAITHSRTLTVGYMEDFSLYLEDDGL